MIRCPFCQACYVTNTIFCDECGVYLLGGEELATDPLETVEVRWQGETDDSQVRDMGLTGTGPLTIHLRIAGKGDRVRELEVLLAKPIRLGRSDPTQDIYPEVDLTDDLGMEYGVSREHACIFRRDNGVEVEDLGSTNGTLLNGERLDPYIPEPLKDGDQLQMGKLLVEVSFKPQRLRKTPGGNPAASGGGYLPRAGTVYL